MKRPYGQYNYPQKELLLSFFKLSPKEIYENIYKMMLSKGFTEYEVKDEFALTYSAAQIELDAINGHCVHYFFTGEGMHEWLINCSAPLTEEQAMIIEKSKDNRNQTSVPFMFHFVRGNSPVYLCRWVFRGFDIHQSIIKDKTLLTVLKGKDHNVISLTPGKIYQDEEVTSCQRLISSALAYIQCFPDTVKDGIPENLKHQNYYRNSPCKSIGMHHSLVQHDGPCPHYRVGHFRFLSSEKFVHKKGQTIFIHGCFVKGQALTVLGIDETGGKHE